MAILLNRLAWSISITLSLLLSFILCDLSSGGYTSAAENLLEWGWIYTLILLWIIKGVIFSEAKILASVGGDALTSSVMPKSPVSYAQQISSHDDSGVEDMMSSKGEISQMNEYTAMKTDPIAENVTTPLRSDLEKPVISDVLVPQEPTKPNWLVTFFSDRPLAKIGGILLFLGALFFLSLVWAAVGAVGKIIIGLIFGFSLYAIGVWMDKKGHIAESRTLLGVGIAINTLTILSGRWIIGDNDSNLLSDTVTLIFLIFNTGFAIVTALVFGSRTFLVFSFVFAYLIPFLIGSESDGAILMILYTAVVSLGGYALSYFLARRDGTRDDISWVWRTILVGSTLLMGLSGLALDSRAELIVYVIVALLITTTGLLLIKRLDIENDSLSAILISGYIMLASALFGMGEQSGTILIYIIAIIPLMVFTGVSLLTLGGTIMLSSLLFVPLIFGVLLFSVFGLASLMYILVPIVGLYACASFFLLGTLSLIFQYTFFIAIAVFLSIFSIALDFRPLEIDSVERGILACSVVLFFSLSLWGSIRHSVSYLSVVSVITSSLLLALILTPSFSLSWIVYVVFLIIGFSYPFISRARDITVSPVSLIAYQVFLYLFMIGELCYLGRDTWFMSESTSLITLGFIIFALSVGSLIYSVALIRSTTGTTLSTISEASPVDRNTISGMLALPLSLFSLAVAVVFSDNALIVAAVWIIESTILAYFSHRTKSAQILIGAIVLLAIGLMRIIPFFDTITPRDWLALIPLSIIGVALFSAVRWIPPRRDIAAGNVYDILHVIGIMMVGYAYMNIIPHSLIGWSLVGMSIFLCIASWFYARIESMVISVWTLILIGGYFLYHTERVGSLDISILPLILQLTALSLALGSAYFSLRKNPINTIGFAFAACMTLLITSLYVDRITNNVFAVTIYLTLVATVFLYIGIHRDRSYLRTIGLYIGIIVLAKILFYDLWAGVDNLIVRVIALMVAGGLMITLSQLYGRRVSRTWSEEFSIRNFGLSSGDSPHREPTAETDIHDGDESMPFDESIASDLRKFDISQIASVELRDMTDTPILISRRAGLIRVANYISTSLAKGEFAPRELEHTLENILPHIRSSLPKKDLEDLLEKINLWIQKGGKIVLVSKKGV